MKTMDLWCVWDPLEGEEHLYSTLEKALDYVKSLCEEGLETGDHVRIEHRTVVMDFTE